ncbi:MAG TPA: glycosyltransferase [Acidimicrobiales bacterium]|nr:glycosyltransferase [Acidimicrobiales bacterium]
MRVLAACSLGGAGHLNPLLPFLAAARERGDETLVVGPPALGEMVELAGYAFRAGGEPPEGEVAPIRERLPLAPPAEASVLGNRDLFGRMATTAMLPGMEQACAEWGPDIVLREPCEYASAVVAGRLHIPNAQVAISLAEGEAASIAAAAPALEAHRHGLVEELTASPYLTRFPASLDPSPFPATVRFRDQPPPPSGPLPDWWDGSTAPLLYMTFGTVLGHMSIAAGVYRAALRAVEDLDVRVLLTVGRQFDRSDLGPVPAHVHVEAWIDQADVFPRADLVVCHGGSGTAFGAVAAGLPVVVVPVFADQFVNGVRIAGTGAGLVVEADPPSTGGPRRVIAQQDAPRVTEGIETVLADPSYRRQARHIAEEVAAAPTVDAVLDTLLPTEPPGAIP